MNRLSLALTLVLLASACGDDVVPDGPDTQLCEPAPAAATTIDPLRWKGIAPLLGDLQQALQLDQETVCRELGSVPCDELYRIPLGGSDPFGVGLYEPVDVPLAITPTVVERVVLSACIARVTLDSDPGASPVVFTYIDLGADTISANTPGVNEQIRELYRRLLAREPGPEEIEAVRGLAAAIDTEPISAGDFATSACFAIATTTDFLFI